MQAGRRGLLVEGWRGINHSIALANQHQLLAMRQIAGLDIYHRDLPFAMTHWNDKDHGAGFPPADRAYLKSLREPHPGKDRVDAVYRISTPIRAEAAAPATAPMLTFMITEIGLSPVNFADHGADRAAYTRHGNAIVTSSAWSRSRLIDYGFPPERVHVVPLGVDAQTFRPVDGQTRTVARAAIGVGDEETLFVNVGAPLWNKGVDVLLRAFAVLRLKGLPVRLIMKEQTGLYGVAVTDMMRTLAATDPALVSDHVLSGISTISFNLEPGQLARLMACADSYLSPYRAEGFNLPVLEALACGVPAIVTAGGATDEFCDDRIAMRIPGRFGRMQTETGIVGAYIEPDFDAVVAAMTAVASGWRPGAAAFAAGRQQMLATCNWPAAAEQTVKLALGDTAAVRAAA